MSELFLPIGLLLSMSWPLLLAVAMVMPAARSTIWRIAPSAALPALLLAVFAPATISLHLPWLLLGTDLGLVDETGRIFLLFTTLLWWLSGMYAKVYLTENQGRSRFLSYFLLAMTGNIGLILAQDLISFYLFFTLMSFASYGLVVHVRSSEAFYAGRVYMILVVIGEVALFAALLLAMTATQATGFAAVRQGLALIETRELILLLAFLGFGIKAGVLGLHVWLPLAHPVAPTPASAVLSGAMIKAGLLGWLRLLPLGGVMLPQWGQFFMLIGLAAAFYGVLKGLRQDSPKTLLAYSSISQMGIMTMAVGLAMSAPHAAPAIVAVVSLYALHHGLSKGALFLGVGLIGACSGASRRWVWRTMWLPALALAGAPLTGGMAVKILLKSQTVYAPAPWDVFLQALLPCSAVATTLLLGRFLVLLSEPQSEASQPGLAGLVWPWALLVTLAVVLPWWFVPQISPLWSPTAILGSFWPVLLGLGLTVALERWRRHRCLQTVRPDTQEAVPGELIKRISRGLHPALRHVRRLADDQLAAWHRAQVASLRRLSSQGQWWRLLGRIEAGLSQWPMAMVILVILGLLMTALAASE